MFKQMGFTMVIVSDMRRSVEFYRDKLGIALNFETPEWTEFLTGTTTLALHGGGVKKEEPAGDPGKQYAGTCSIGFSVENVDETFELLKSRGVYFVMPPTEREGEGIRLAVAVDPDGLAVSFAQPIRQSSDYASGGKKTSKV
jgi:predicted enzyme related to lactoylglutathione lyase